MDDGATETHLLAWLRVGVERVVVAIQTVQVCCLHCGLMDMGVVGVTRGWRVVGLFGSCGWVSSTLSAFVRLLAL